MNEQGVKWYGICPWTFRRRVKLTRGQNRLRVASLLKEVPLSSIRPQSRRSLAAALATPDCWAEVTDAVLLCAVAEQDRSALLELHRRYAPSLYALVQDLPMQDRERQVQHSFLFIYRQAHCHARSSLDARRRVIGVAHHLVLSTQMP